MEPPPLDTLTMRGARERRSMGSSAIDSRQGPSVLVVMALLDDVQVGVAGALPRVVVNGRVVHQYVEVRVILPNPCGGRLDAGRVGHVQPDARCFDTLGAQRFPGCPASRLAAAAENQRVTHPAQLAADLETDAAVGAGDQSDSLRIHDGSFMACTPA